MAHELIPPHGGTLIDRTIPSPGQRLASAADLPSIEIGAHTLADLECIATGVYSPLEGFMGREDHESVVTTMRLTNGLAWPIPITLQTTSEASDGLNPKDEIALRWNGEVLAKMTLTDIYEPDQDHEVKEVFGTSDNEHPGVAAVRAGGNVYLGGPIELLRPIPHEDFREERLTPAETRALFTEKGWKRIAAFQTRNPIHRAHEYLLKVALEMSDGLLLHPLVGPTKKGDISSEVRMRTYEAVLEVAFPPERTVLSVYPAAMRYAGPREAILHAISRKNYGVTHFIVGRDHAGVGDYYGTYDAQEIFDEFDPAEIGIEPLCFEHAGYCKKMGELVSLKTSPYGKSEWVFLSGTKVREMLSRGELPPPEFTRPEVAEILAEAYRAMESE